jgi:hypothetical protein
MYFELAAISAFKIGHSKTGEYSDDRVLYRSFASETSTPLLLTKRVSDTGRELSPLTYFDGFHWSDVSRFTWLNGKQITAILGRNTQLLLT